MRTTAICGGLFIAAFALLPSHLHAAEAGNILPGSFSGNVAIVSDYIVRGMSLSNEDPAIQGGLDWDSGYGFYAGTWASSVEFGNDASAEIDFFAGYRRSVGAIKYEVGVTYYWYPETTTPGQSFWDVHADLGYDFGPVFAGIGLAYTTDDYGPLVNDQTLYYEAELAAPVAEMLTVSGSIGYSAAERRQNHVDWDVGATFKAYDWFNLDIRYYDTNYEAVCGTQCDARVVVKVSRAF